MKRFAIILFLVLFPLLRTSSLSAQSESEDTGGTYPTESQGEDTNTINIDRSAYDHPNVPQQKFSKELRISSQRQHETRPHYFVMDGYVDIYSKGMRLQADHAEYDTDTHMLTATGNVVMDQEDQRVTGDKIELNVDTQKGTLYNVFGYFPPQIFFWGKTLEKIGDDDYKLHDGVFTECTQVVPHWKLKTSTARLTVNKYVRFSPFTLKAKNVPFFYLPYMMWPIKRDRASGILFPTFGKNSTKGFYIGDAFFWAMNRSMDLTLSFEHWDLRGWGEGAEYRYATTEKSGGSAKYFFIDDAVLGKQWHLNAQVNQELPGDWRVASIIDTFSSFEYIQDYDNSFSGSARVSQKGQGFATKNWSYYSLNMLGDWSETQRSRTHDVRLYHYPEVEFESRNQQIPHTPLFWTLRTSYDLMGRGDAFGQFDLSNSWQRYDVFPTLQYPITYLSWLTATPSFSYRVTKYTKSQTDTTSIGIPVVVDEPVTRDYYDFTLDVRGPNFSKIFETPNMKYSQKWKHAIEPQVTYHRLQDIDDLDSIIIVDGDIDDIIGTNAITYSVTNYLYSKRPVEPEEEYKDYEYQYYNPKPLEEPAQAAWEFISWKLSQTYLMQSDSFQPELNPVRAEQFQPVSSVVRVNPTQDYNVEFRLDYDVKFHMIEDVSIGSTLRDENRWYSNVSYNLRNALPFEGTGRDSHQIRFNGGVGFYDNRYVFTGETDYDILNKDLIHNSIGFAYNDDCFSLGIEWRHYDFGDQVFGRPKENQINFSFSIPNIGGFVPNNSANPPRRF